MVLVINLILTMWAVSRSSVQNGLGTLQDGSCKRTETLTFWAHLAINVLSTLLLGASNYSMQCLSSPTRSEIDKAHGQGVWLDIGVPSVRNLRRLSTTRIVLWYLLATSSIPLHLLYNSAVFSSLCTREYTAFLVSSEFMDGAPFNVTPILDPYETSPNMLQNYENIAQKFQKNQTSVARLENKACVEIYTAPIISTNSDLLLVSNYSEPNNSVLDLLTGIPGIVNNQPQGCLMAFNSHCANPQDWSIDIPDNEQLPPPGINGTRIQYCLSQRVEEHCKLQFSLAIMIGVIICNLIKTICMSTIAWRQDPEPLVTLGDAITSFLDRPDVTTKGNCIVGKTRFEDGRSWGLLLSNWDPKRLHWFQGASKRRWLLCNTL